MDSRNQKVFIKIIKLSADLLQIEPVAVKNNSYRNSDLSIEFSTLERQLKEYGLVLNEDFVANHGPYPSTGREYRFDFIGKSLVVRALHAIPADIIQFEHSPYSNNQCLNKNEYEKYKSNFALKLTSKNCFHSETICVQQAQTIMFNTLLNDIVAVHTPFSKGNSQVINQLKYDIEILSTRQDTLFVNSNFMLLMAALQNAASDEKEKNTITQSSLAGLFGKESKLYPEYEKLIVKYANYFPQLFKATQYSNKFDPITQNLNVCYQLINPKNSNIININNGKK